MSKPYTVIFREEDDNYELTHEHVEAESFNQAIEAAYERLVDNEKPITDLSRDKITEQYKKYFSVQYVFAGHLEPLDSEDDDAPQD